MVRVPTCIVLRLRWHRIKQHHASHRDQHYQDERRRRALFRTHSSLLPRALLVGRPREVVYLIMWRIRLSCSSYMYRSCSSSASAASSTFAAAAAAAAAASSHAYAYKYAHTAVTIMIAKRRRSSCFVPFHDDRIHNNSSPSKSVCRFFSTSTVTSATNNQAHASDTRSLGRPQKRKPSSASSSSTSWNSPTYLVDQYEQLCREGQTARDEHQIRALAELDRLRFQLVQRHADIGSSSNSPRPTSTTNDAARGAPAEEGEEVGSSGGFFSKLFSSSPFGIGSGSNEQNTAIVASRSQPPPRGVYLHGGVGCGKTYCMSLFYDSLLDKTLRIIGSQKVHFHAFMLTVHKQMHEAKMVEGIQGDVVPRVVERILDDGLVICFDEFQVTDVADALILKRLFTGLIDRGAIIVATSNRPPRDLYLNGLQRDRFLPFIDLLEEKTEVVSMWESETDYRLIQGASAAKGVYFVGKESREDFDGVFRALTKGEIIGKTYLTTQGRRVLVPLASLEVGCARFHFDDLCRKALGAADYIAIAENFHTVFCDGIPKLSLNDINVLRRLITFVDCMYENHVKLILHLDTLPKDIFEVDLDNAHQDEAFSFDRTRSRLDEMGGKAYLAKRWVGRNNKVPAGQTDELKHDIEFLVEEDDGIESEKDHKKGRHLYRHAKSSDK